MRWRLDLAYDGADFSGWASQPGLRTVQGVLEHWIPQVLRLSEPVQLTVAGRTDAGVHAAAQVCHVDLPDDLDPTAASPELLAHRLRRVLPDDLVVHRVSPAPEGFDARFSAIWRRYCYRLWDEQSTPLPTLRHRVARVKGTLDIAAMDAAAQQWLGLHDFAAFCKPRDGATTIRTLEQIKVARADDAQGTVEIWLRADAFCHSMVRSLVGALTAVGQGRRDAAWAASLVDQSRGSSEILVMPAAGLTLEQVAYPADDQLAARARQARSRRDEEA